MFLCQIVFLAYVNTDPKFMYSNFRVDANNVGAYPPARPAMPFGRVPIRAGSGRLLYAPNYCPTGD